MSRTYWRFKVAWDDQELDIFGTIALKRFFEQCGTMRDYRCSDEEERLRYTRRYDDPHSRTVDG